MALSYLKSLAGRGFATMMEADGGGYFYARDEELCGVGG